MYTNTTFTNSDIVLLHSSLSTELTEISSGYTVWQLQEGMTYAGQFTHCVCVCQLSEYVLEGVGVVVQER